MGPFLSEASASGRWRALTIVALVGIVAVVMLTTRRVAREGVHGAAGIGTVRLRGEGQLIQEAQVAHDEGLKFDGPDKIFDPLISEGKIKPLEDMSRAELIAAIEELEALKADTEAAQVEDIVSEEELEAEAEEAEEEEEAAIAYSEANAGKQTESSTGNNTSSTEGTTQGRTTTATTLITTSTRGPTSTAGLPAASALSNFGTGGDTNVDNLTLCGRKCLVGILKDDELKKIVHDFNCDDVGGNCMSQKCCALPGLQCYQKNKTFAQCKESCVPRVDLRDEDKGNWTCGAIGHRAPGPAVKCSDVGENCLLSRCCELPGTMCFLKNASYAACKAECTPDEPDQVDEDPSPWKCRPLGPKTRGAASWVSSTCSKAFEECSATMCCAEPGMQCFEKDTYWAQCLPSCDEENGAGSDWSCKTLSERTPPMELDALPMTGPVGGKVAQWVADSCAGGYEDCSKSRCCKAPGYQCYLKSEWFGMCKESCSTDSDELDNSTWSCEEAGPRSYGLALKGFPSLYCWSLVRVSGYELQLVRKQAEAYAGIFACDGYHAVADGSVTIHGTTALTIDVSQVPVGVSSDGTAANTLMFIKAWEAVLEEKHFENFDWTLKVDPDAVLLPDRVRDHVRPHTRTGLNEDKHYILNCNAFPDRPSFPMMYGALEVFSRKAILKFSYAHKEHCVDKFEWEAWGEDVFMVSCMNALGVGKLNDFKIIGDNTCIGGVHHGADCNDAELAAFHPFKDIGSWTSCFQAATGVVLSAALAEEVPAAPATASSVPPVVQTTPVQDSMWLEPKLH